MPPRSTLPADHARAMEQSDARPAASGSWKLQDAKAHFSEVVRAAQTKGPQRVTVRGKAAAIVISAEEYARLAPLAAEPSLHALLSRSPLRDLEFERESVRAPVRDVAL
jgi:antitoxin Phd